MRRDWIRALQFFSPMILLMLGWVFQPFGKIGALFFFLATSIAWAAGLYFFLRRKHEQMLVAEAEWLKEVLSRQRHDLMNHVQILMGYQSLKKPERITAYLQKLIQTATHERTISEIGYAPLAVSLLTLDQRYKQWAMSVEVENSLQLPTLVDERRLLKTLDTSFAWLDQTMDGRWDGHRVELHLYQGDAEVACEIQLLREDGEKIAVRFEDQELEQLQNKLDLLEAELVPAEEYEGIGVKMNLGTEV